MSEPERPSILEQATAMIQQQATNSVAGGAIVTEREHAAQLGVKVGGQHGRVEWGIGAWFRWAKDKLTGRRDRAGGIGGELRW